MPQMQAGAEWLLLPELHECAQTAAACQGCRRELWYVHCVCICVCVCACLAKVAGKKHDVCVVREYMCVCVFRCKGAVSREVFTFLFISIIYFSKEQTQSPSTQGRASSPKNISRGNIPNGSVFQEGAPDLQTQRKI